MIARLLLAVSLAALCAAVLGLRTYTDATFERVRMRVVKEPITTTRQDLAIPLPDLSSLAGQPSALIVRLRATSDTNVTVALVEQAAGTSTDAADRGRPQQAVGTVFVPAGKEVRADLGFVPVSGRETVLALSSTTSAWSLAYVEVSNLHGQARGWINLLILPEGRSHRRVVSGWLSLAVFAGLVWAGLLRRRVPHRVWRVVFNVISGVAAVVLLVSLTSTAITSYRVLVSLSTAILLIALVYLEPMVRGASHLRPYLQPVARALRPDARLTDVGPLPNVREVLLAVLGFTLFTVVLLHEQVWNLGHVPDLGDPLFSMWRMAWVAHQAVTDPRHLFDANIFFPDRGTLTYSDAMLLPALPNALLRASGAHPVTAYTLLFLSAFIFSATTAYVLGRSFAFTVAGAWVAGLVFGFYVFRFEHYSHLELQLSGWMPLVLLSIHRLVLANAGVRTLLAGAVALGAQWYSSMYFGLFLSVYAAAFAAILLWTRGWPRRELRSVMGVLALGTLVALPLAAVYTVYGEQRGERAPVIVDAFSAVPLDYLESTDRRALYQGVTLGHGRGERQLFPGLVPPLLGAAGLTYPFSATRLAAAGAGLVAFDGSLGLNGVWYRVAYEWLSPFQSIRVPARFSMLIGLSMAILAGAAATRWTSHGSAGRRLTVMAALTVALMADAWPALKLVPVWPDVPPIYEPLRQRADAVLLELPLNAIPEAFPENIPSMYLSMWHWSRMVNGYSGHLPGKYSEIVKALKGFPTAETLETARQLGVTHVSVVCAIDGPHQAFGVPAPDVERCRQKILVLDGSPLARALVRTDWRGAPANLYELVR